jgi:hypothetical protein
VFNARYRHSLIQLWLGFHCFGRWVGDMDPLTSHPHLVPAEIDDRRKGSDRREASRKKLLRGGRTFWPNGDSTECTVHNLSDTGAQLQTPGPVPANFDLIIDGEELPRSCCVVWRKASRIGVKFQGQIHGVRASTDPIRKVSSFRQYAEECRMLAKRAESPDRDALLKMAEAWEKINRRLRKRTLAW